MALTHLPENPRQEARNWNLQLGVPGFKFADLNRVRRLEALDRAFFAALRDADAALAEDFQRYRDAGGAGYARLPESELLLRVAPHAGAFVARLFHIDDAHAALHERLRSDQLVFEWKRQFVERHILKSPPAPAALAQMDPVELEFAYREVVDALMPDAALTADPERELAVVTTTLQAVIDRTHDEIAEARLAAVEAWVSALAFHPALAQRRRQFTCFHVPHKVDFDELVPRIRPRADLPEFFMGQPESRRHRDGFNLTDPRYTARENLREAHYCLTCHDRGKDSCSTGLHGKDGAVQKNPLGIALDGCPLDEKISEMIQLYRDGHAIGALAVIMIDNPMVAGTGHRICNDCMKACIFQKQDPVNIPQIETGVLTDVLHLPYGFEIFSLLARWNPLNARRPYPLRYNGKNVLVVGMGPAGYTLAQHLLNEGFGVIGIEGLKVEPLALPLRGAKRRVPRPIRDVSEVVGPLSERPTLGFGGVAEYGITVRWDKNFLDLNYILLMRRKKFRLLDGVRFGGTLNIEDAWSLGFDHIAITAGAGRPTIVPMQNNLARGVRMASDFLMALQGQGAYRKNSLTNLQIELPAVVIGGGLTAIDTATELQAYYVTQVEKTLERYERLKRRIDEAAIWAGLDPEETRVARTWLDHGRMVQAERAAAQAAGRPPDFARLVRSWGGVTIVYRKRLQDSPAYRLNHEEVIKSLEEGIGFIESMSPDACLLDEFNHVRALRCARMALVDGKWKDSGEKVELPARAVMVAAGTNPNVVYEKEHPHTFVLDERHGCFAMHRVVDGPDGTSHVEPVGTGGVGFFTSYEKDGRFISFYGDAHPVFAGNVVKAMASARLGYSEITRLFTSEVIRQDIEEQAERENAWVRFAEVLEDGLRAVVVDAIRLADRIVEVIVRAPVAARNFRPGQFYRMQNYEGTADMVEGIRLTMEGLALTGAWTDPARGLISLIVLEMGGSSRLCSVLEPGEEIVLAGPTGTATEIPEFKTILLAGGGLGNAVMFSIAAAMKAHGNRVIYFAGYKRAGDLFKRRYIEDACDLVVWSVDEGPAIATHRAQDRSIVGNIVQAMNSYARGELGDTPIRFQEIDRLICIGSDRMMDAVRQARHTVLHDVFRDDHVAIGSINSPMQCMLKEVCSQCLQRHVDPATGRESLVFSCFNQDQPLDRVDFQFLHQRLRQNSTAEKLTSLWLDQLFAQREVQVV
ncbi:MAG TPA: FAD-dependent oxidoreductase [Candidatus Kryptonia bacterium]|nr:FAD-dependent oxidoreductase [Candidatus Kryptonia bacterium]